jgi:hypothetical protein
MMQGEEIYISKANGGAIPPLIGGARSPYNIAVAEWFNRPQILEVDLSSWTDGSGGTIRVRAQDDVKVQQVKVMIADESGTPLEEGEARDVGALWWEYSTVQATVDNLRVTVFAKDLPGHVTERTELKGHPKVA